MGWTTPTTRATGYLVTAANWNTDLVDNLAYLKGQAGIVEMEAGIKSDTDVTDDLGATDKLWKEGHFRTVFGSRMRVNPNIREVQIDWQAGVSATYASDQSSGSGSVLGAGSGQVVFEVNDNSVGVARLDQVTESGGSFNNAWNIARLPYMRVEFGLNAERSTSTLFLGFRETVGAAIPTVGANAEKCLGIIWSGTVWRGITGDGTTVSTGTPSTLPTDNDRNVLEIKLATAGSSFEVWLNGVRVLTKTTNVPSTGTLEWSFLLTTDGAGGATQNIMTMGRVVFQENLS